MVKKDGKLKGEDLKANGKSQEQSSEQSRWWRNPKANTRKE